MGHHYLPQHYLRCFSTPDNPDYIWMYDKSSKEFDLTGPFCTKWKEREST